MAERGQPYRRVVPLNGGVDTSNTSKTTEQPLNDDEEPPPAKRGFKRIVYPVFSQELRRIGKTKRQAALSRMRAIRAEIKTVRNSMRGDRRNPEKKAKLDTLYETLRLMRDADRESKQQFLELRKTVKAECRVMKGRPITSSDCELIIKKGEQNAWETRIPHMQKLFPICDEKARSRYVAHVGDIFTNCEGGDSIEQIRDLIEGVIERSACQPHVIDATSVDSLVYGLGSHFKTLLSRLMASQPHFDECVGNSYHHDLFDKTVLLKGKRSAWKLRMHVFSPEEFTEAQEEVHSHRNHFVSHIVHGSITQELWEEPLHCVPEEQESEVISFQKYVYSPTVTEDGTNVFNINPLGTISLARVEQATVSKGGLYYMHPSVLHSVNAIDGCTITLVLNSPQATKTSCFASLEPWSGESFVRQRITAEEMKILSEKVLRLVD